MEYLLKKKEKEKKKEKIGDISYLTLQKNHLQYQFSVEMLILV